MILFRPIGLRELTLIAKAGFKLFPPRLSHQPIFRPALDREYAERIARDWSTNDRLAGYAGFVIRFEIDQDYAQRFNVHVVGSRSAHRELYVRAEELDEFSNHLIGKITVLSSYYGKQFSGEIDPETQLPTAIARV
jgi:hypothetical protein